MKLSDQVVSLEIAQKLRSLGVKQDSYFYWQNIFLDEYKLIHAENHNCNQHNGPGDITWLNIKKRENKAFSAFTVSELGKLLHWEKLYIFGTPEELLDHIDGKNSEAEARGKMLIYLIENKIIEV